MVGYFHPAAVGLVCGILTAESGLSERMNKTARSLPISLVREYIEAAAKTASSASEKEAVAQACLLADDDGTLMEPRAFSLFYKAGASGLAKSLGDESLEVNSENIREESLEVDSWRNAIFREVHIALCRRSRKYAKEVATLRQNGKLLIGAVAGYVAASVGVSVAVIAALVAAVLHLVLKIGTSAFCRKFRLWHSK